MSKKVEIGVEVYRDKGVGRNVGVCAYPSDLSDREWQLLEPLLRPITYPRREIVNAIRYVLRTGCSWRMLPHDLPPFVFHYFPWRRDGAWQRVHGVLHAELRQAQGRQASPSAAIIDSQSVKTTEKGGLEVTTPARR